jgi:hypothetical protein
MTREKTGDPKDREQQAGGATFVPVAATFGTMAIVPGPLTAGPPQPEPEERWTLAPGHHPAAAGPPTDQPDEGVDDDPDATEPGRDAAAQPR